MCINPCEISVNRDRDLVGTMSKDHELHQEAVAAFEERGHGFVIKNRLDKDCDMPRILFLSKCCIERLAKDTVLRNQYGTLIDAIVDYAERNPLCKGCGFYYTFIVHEG